MKKIINDFRRGELKRFGMCALGLVLCVLILAVLPEARPMLPYMMFIFAVLLIIVFGVAAVRFFLQSRPDRYGLSDGDTLLLEQQYAAEHPVYKVAYGEIHLLHDFLMSRNKGRLIVIPLDRIEMVDERFRLVGGRRVPCIFFLLDTGKRIPIDFSAWNYKDGEPVINWLIDRIGAEKVERGIYKPSILR